MLFFIVDDDELSRELLAMLLGAEGHEVEVAASGEEAVTRLSAIEGPCPEVILSDMQMPGLSGEALACALRGVTGDKVKLLAMSGSRPSGAALNGFDGFLLKPFSIADLDALLVRNGVDTSSDSLRGGLKLDYRSNPEMPELNEDIYAKMAMMIPGKQLGEMYAMCLADARTRITQMSRLAVVGDDAGYRKAAHTVKGGCGMIGAAQLYQLAETAEREGLASGHDSSIRTSGVTELLEHFSGACDRLERILEKRC